MEAEAPSQIAVDSYTRASPPFLGHQFFPGGSFGDNMSGGRHSSYTPRVLGGSTSGNRSSEGVENGRYDNGHRMGWDAKQWNWDSILFLAQPSGSAAGATRGSHQNGNVDQHYTHPNGIDFRLDREGGNADRNGSSDLEDTHTARRGKDLVRNQEKEHASDSGGRTQPFLRDGSSPEEDAGSLSLKLGVVHSYAGSDDGGSGSRDAKRYRSSSPGSQLPMCQVDDCKADLSRAKDYHQRHKVCEAHAKATKALVSRLMQRFCQQCSRFHPLAEFDEGKRSCRRRLAGHNRRRRKNQPEPPTGRSFLGLDETGSAPGLVGILNVLSSLQAANQTGVQSGICNDRDALLQYSKALVQPATGGREGLTPAALASLLGRNGNIPEVRQPENKLPSFTGQTQSAEAELLAALAGPRSPEEALALLLQSTWRSAILKAAESPLVQVAQNNGNSAFPMASPSTRMPSEMPPHSVGGPVLSLSSAPPAGPVHVNNGVSSSRGGLSRNHTAPKQHSRQRPEHLHAKILQPPSRPVAVAQTLFPVSQAGQCANNGQFSVNVEDGSSSDPDAPSTIPYSHANDSPDGPSRYDLNESSPSGSDQSPSSSSADWQDRTGRISIKLFDRNPGELPLDLRPQILEWLAHRPSNMESYIRPGCTVVTVFLSMPRSSWSELDRTLRSGLQRLVYGREFWMRGRIHMQVDRRNAFIHDGRVQILRPLRTTAVPQLLSVRPLAVVMGQRTNIVLKGRNLNQPETRVYCAYNGKYVLQDVSDGEQRGSQRLTFATENESGWEEVSICFDGSISDVVGRAFIEVERQTSGGNSLPVIVADGPVCKELESLENSCAQVSDSEEDEQHHDDGADGTTRRLNAKDFVSELGWLFQRSQASHEAAASFNLLPARQRELLWFAVERDWCAVVKKTLDIHFEYVLAFPENMAKLVEILADVGEGNILHAAVQKRCVRVVQLLLSYTPFLGAGSADSEAFITTLCKSRSQTRFLFTPDMKNREGLTPLHMAATMDGAEKIIDALTNDPNQIGVHTWISVCNGKGESPQVSALSSGNASYVQLVIRKTTRRLDGAVAIDVRPEKKAPKSGEKINGAVGTLELATWCTEASKVLGDDDGGKGLVLTRSCRHVPRTLRGFRGGTMYRPFLLSMMTIAAVCVCACIIMRGSPEVLCTRTFAWNKLKSGAQ